KGTFRLSKRTRNFETPFTLSLVLVPSESKLKRAGNDISGLSFTNLDQTIDVNSSTEVGSTVFTVETDDDDVNAVSMTSQSTLFQLDTTDNRSVVVMDCLTAGYQEVVSFQATDGISVVTASLTLDVLDN
ncbi:hypothetical protein MAR_009956, partial [Mya arenaria]